jgi:molybdopterin synthase catalytic subunit
VGDAFEIVEGEINVAAMIRAAQRPDSGAINTFVGTTRVDDSDGASVEYLEYEAYRPMADEKLAEIGAEIRKKWDVRHVAITHRLGKVAPGEASVAIVVASPRRGPAFEASRHAIERIKEIVPIWKREVWSDGYVWVGSQIGTRGENGGETPPK